MKIKGRVRSGDRLTAERPTTRVTKGRIVARATGGLARIDAPTERGGARRQEKKFD
jgi:hypothetical protein